MDISWIKIPYNMDILFITGGGFLDIMNNIKKMSIAYFRVCPYLGLVIKLSAFSAAVLKCFFARLLPDSVTVP